MNSLKKKNKNSFALTVNWEKTCVQTTKPTILKDICAINLYLAKTNDKLMNFMLQPDRRMYQTIYTPSNHNNQTRTHNRGQRTNTNIRWSEQRQHNNQHNQRDNRIYNFSVLPFRLNWKGKQQREIPAFFFEHCNKSANKLKYRMIIDTKVNKSA